MNSLKVFQGESARTTSPYEVYCVLHDGSEVLGRIIRDFAHVLAQDRSAGEDADGVPIGFFDSSERPRPRPTPAGFVQDYDGLSQNFARRHHQGPGADIRRTARRITNDEVNGFGGIFFLGRS